MLPTSTGYKNMLKDFLVIVYDKNSTVINQFNIENTTQEQAKIEADQKAFFIPKSAKWVLLEHRK